MDIKDTVGTYEYARAVGHSMKHVYELIRLGRIPARKMGKRGVWRIAKSVLEDALAKKEKQC